MPRPLLTARWSHLVLATYHAPPALLEPYLPPGVELELFDGQPAVSMVTLVFSHTRLWGAIPVPGHQRFAQWNLRTYVRPRAGPDAERGVVFLREFVPKRLMALAGSALNDPFRVAGVRGDVVIGGPENAVSARYTVQTRGTTHTVEATAPGPLLQPGEHSIEHRLKERFFSYTRTRSGRTRRFHVWHPAWRTYADARVNVAIDWASLYGPEWGAMQTAAPFSLIFAEGSEAALHRPRRWP